MGWSTSMSLSRLHSMFTSWRRTILEVVAKPLKSCIFKSRSKAALDLNILLSHIRIPSSYSSWTLWCWPQVMSGPIASQFSMHLEWEQCRQECTLLYRMCSIWPRVHCCQKSGFWKNLPNQKDVLVLCGTHILWSGISSKGQTLWEIYTPVKCPGSFWA